MDVVNLKYIIKLQKNIKSKIKFLDNLKNEIKFIFLLIENLTKRIQSSLSTNIISQSKFNQNMISIEEIIKKYKKLVLKKEEEITITKFKNVNKYSFLLKISTIKLDLINLIKSCGCLKTINILKLILTPNEIDIIFQNKNNSEIFSIINNYF